MWDPDLYRQFSDERSRPFFDLVGRIDVGRPDTVVDLGCGPGELTASLSARWPTSQILGVDSSAAMLDRAAAHAGARVRFQYGDLRTWRPDGPVDVIISNAALQWVPEHTDLLPDLVSALTPSGWLAFQVPGNFAEPSHVLLHELSEDSRFAPHLGDIQRPDSDAPARYLSTLTDIGCRVDAWETTYLHVLSGPDAVFRWISGTGARPVLEALPTAERASFASEYRALLRDAYPQRGYGTLLPFRRIFVVAQREVAEPR